MKRIARIVVLCGLASLFAALIGMGCSQDTGKPSEQDRKDFTGAGISPADKAKLNAAMAQKAAAQMRQLPPRMPQGAAPR
jgi:hypothetical protein